jgi:uncharacterized protein
MKALIILVMAVGLVLIALVAVNTGPVPSDRIIQVTGGSRLSAFPDEGVVVLRVEHTRDSAEAAQQAVATGIESVRVALRSAGVADGQIETRTFRVFQKQEWDGRTQVMEFKGFTAIHTLQITVDKLDTIGRILDDAVSAGANGVDQISFQLTAEKQREIRRQLLQEAAMDAREKAEAIASGVGVRLGNVASVQESGPVFYPMAYRLGAVEDVASTDISPQQLDITASLSVDYLIG